MFEISKTIVNTLREFQLDNQRVRREIGEGIKNKKRKGREIFWFIHENIE